MAYVPIASQDTEPTDSRMAGTAAREFRTLKAYLGGLVITVNGLNTRVAALEGGGWWRRWSDAVYFCRSLRCG